VLALVKVPLLARVPLVCVNTPASLLAIVPAFVIDPFVLVNSAVFVTVPPALFVKVPLVRVILPWLASVALLVNTPGLAFVNTAR